ncbi:L-lysine 6-monooxygenase (NADPH-requiring)-domain-containing protein [Thelephora terrestris]|uniref:L-ornithine N(5)-monooxygenase [NAD(P)H] n=1 Tax=Thelephora terrestris TaxID=56493 RepID=A0A9P6LC82_9AGAM|nr:L-lysine 6-monooxygenase (NADPH-requiring)-domain-containing protein [Thelephora terrestris]
MNSPSPLPQVYNLIGLGFGPANLALSGALLECDFMHKDICFIEKHDKFRWHPGMLLPGTRMQISWLKDLATLRNPQSPLTFLNYLHFEGRLISFINNGSPTPSRKEFTDYLAWAANYVQSKGVSVFFDEQVIAIPKGPDGTVDVVSRNLRTGQHITRRTKNLVISPGGSPRMPSAIDAISPHPRVIHSSSYLTSIYSILSSIVSSRRDGAEALRQPVKVAVVGSGQSAAEIVIDLHSKLREVVSLLPNADGDPARHKIDLIINKGSLKPSDESPFSNKIFDPASTDTFFGLRSKATREMVLREFRATNYGVVNPRTIDNLHELLYEQQMDDSILRRAKLNGDKEEIRQRSVLPPHITIHSYSSLVALDLIEAPTGVPDHKDDDVFLLTLQSDVTKQLSQLEYDIVICATGYDRSSWLQLLRRSELGKDFIHGNPSPSAPVLVLPDHAQKSDLHAPWPVDLSVEASGMTDGSTSTSSSVSTLPTSWESPPPNPCGHLSHGDIAHDPPSKVYVTRAYRLVPEVSGAEPLPRIYIQGCTESTHGLSDTLLSVISIKAGEIAVDLSRR